MATPVVVVPAGGLPVTEALSPYGWPMIESPNGLGLPVTFSTGGIPVAGISAFIPGSPVNTVAPVISGTTTIGQVLSCTTGTWSPTATSYAYFWRRNGSLIAGATASTYTLVAADNAAAMTCRVVGTNAIGPSLGIISNTLTLADVTPVNSVAPAITGTATVGSVLTVTNGTWSNSPSFTRQWRRGGVAIGSATATTYTLVAADNIAVIDCVVTATNATAVPVTANSNSVTVAEARPVNSVAPVVTGTATVGQVLSCGTGTWSNTPSSYAYQWTRSGVDISGATSATYLLVTADTGASVQCLVVASNAIGAAPAPAYSNAMTIGAAGTTTVTAPNGQWWKFTGSVTNGVYVNGDPWVLDPGGGVSLIEVSYMPAGTGQEARNGGMINPTFNTMVESATATPLDVTTALRQGYDGRIDESAVRTNWIYDAAYNAHATLPKTLVVGDSLVSSRSQNYPPPTTEGPCTQTFAEFWAVAGSNKRALSRMAVLTVVGSAPFADSFRPNYFGTTKINKRFSDCNLALLPDLTAPYNPKGVVQEAFHLDSSSIYFGGPDENRPQSDIIHINSMRDVLYWLFPAATSNRMMVQPHFNQYWHSSVGTTMGQLAMYCMCDFADRDLFLKRVLQAAIDAYAIASSSTLYMVPFSSGAGFFPSPCWIIRLAGLLFNDTGMKNAKDISTNHVDYASVAIKKWGEMNRVYLTPNATAHAQYARVPGEDYTAGFPLYGDRPTADRSAGQSSNGTEKDPAGVFDMHDYKYATPHPNYMSAVPYTNWAPLSGPNAGVEQTGPVWDSGWPPPYNAEPFLGAFSGGLIGGYMNSNQQMGMPSVLSSIAMGDEAFWGGAVVPFAKRFAYDRKMWLGWGTQFDSSDVGDYTKDVNVFGGSGNGWMTDMWEQITAVPDVTAPVLSSPVATETSSNAASLTVTTNEANGTIYWVVTTSATPPSKAQIKLGQTNTGATAPDSGSQAVSGTGAQSITGGAAGLSASTAYYAYFMHEDTSANQSNVATDGFTTSAGGGATTIFTQTLGSDQAGAANYTFRVYLPITGGAGGSSQIRVTFQASGALGTLHIDNASIAISVEGADEFDATATPVNLLFSGSASVNIAQGTSTTSDWATLGGFTGSNHLLITMDFGASNYAAAWNPSVAVCQRAYTGAANHYNQQNITYDGVGGNECWGINKIEVQ